MMLKSCAWRNTLLILILSINGTLTCSHTFTIWQPWVNTIPSQSMWRVSQMLPLCNAILSIAKLLFTLNKLGLPPRLATLIWQNEFLNIQEHTLCKCLKTYAHKAKSVAYHVYTCNTLCHTPQTPQTLSHILFHAKISWNLTNRHHRLIEDTKNFPKPFADWKSDHY